jgi:Ca2+-binding RTX toxin-like protein
MTHKHKIITTIAAVALLSTGLLTYSITTKNLLVQNILSSMGYGEKVLVNAQTAGAHILTVAVEQYTPNHLPNITGTCTIGDTLDFTIKKGNTGLVSETFSKLCDISPYTTNPTITLPDGKYQVDVTLASQFCIPAAITTPVVNGTTGNNTLRGTVDNNTIYGNGGNDRIFGAAGNDTLYAGNPTNSTSGITSIFGDGGCDKLYGGTGSTALNGTNDTLKGVGEKDFLTGGVSLGSRDNFIIGNGQGTFYLGNGDSDYAEIINFDCSIDQITANGIANNYSITYSGIYANIYYINLNGTLDLVAKVVAPPGSINTGTCLLNYVLT